ncbi:bacteriohemerythrin [Helicovermis profundi]|uniref:Bacteriohemerythrin n=1 Tax=Helicovermis profundi TaxID=3065157 RepID=A0AAU9EG43_9FIRM|nr:bacteriohemerythrin [Clostridia bacterium S502]
MFTWDEKYSVGIEVIDQQHKKLFAIGEEIHDKIIKDSCEEDECLVEALKVLEELKQYTVYHFTTEEELLKKYNYMELENHLIQHDLFINYLEDIDPKRLEKYPKEYLYEIMMYISKWIFKHISTVDFKYVDFLKINMI